METVEEQREGNCNQNVYMRKNNFFNKMGGNSGQLNV